MTTAIPLPAPVTTGSARVLSVARLQLVSWPLFVAWPVGLLITSALIPWVIFSLVDTGAEYNVTGSMLSVYGFVVAFYILAMTQMFSFALRLGSTRSHYMQSMVAIAVAQSAVFAIAFQLLSVLEAATGGWGVDMRMFGILRFVTDSSVVQFLGFFATMLLIVALSMLIGAIQHRWRATGLLTAAASVVVIGGLAAILVTWTRSWSSLWSWIVDASPTTTLVVLPLLVAAVCVGATWQVARHAAP